MNLFKSIFSLAVLTLLTFNAFGQLANKDRGCVPLRVEFTPPSGASGFVWDLGDGVEITDRNPFRNYATAGTFIIQFREVSGGTVTARDTIVLYDKPEIEFEGDTLAGCVPLDVGFTSMVTADPDIPITGYNWSFGDGNSGSGANPSHTYNVPGIRKVGLTVSSSFEGCTAFTEIDDYITVNQSPATSFTPSATTACDPPLDVLFTNTTPDPDNLLTYSWDFGNGQTSTAVSPATIVYNQNGAFTASLTATDTVGCSNTFSVQIGVGSPAASFDVPDTVCTDALVQLMNTSSAGDYLWQINPRANVDQTTQTNPILVFDEPGDYVISLTVTSTDTARCATTVTKTIYAEEIVADFEVDPSLLCELPGTKTYTALGSGVTANWSIFDERIDSTYASMDNPYQVDFLRDTQTYGYNGLRILEVTLIATNARGCVAQVERLDTIRPPNALFRPDTTFGCAPLPVTFQSSHSTSFEEITRYTYIWGDGSAPETFNNDAQVTHTFTQAGEYNVVLIIENALGCIDTSYAVPIEVGAPVNVNFTADKSTICPGDSIQFMGSSIDSMLIDAWHFDTDGSRVSHCADDRNPNWTFGDMAGPMDVTLTVLYNGCPSSLTRNDFVEVNGPIAKLDYEMDCSDPFEYIFADSSMEATTVRWDFGDGNTSNLQHPSNVYDATGDYLVTLTAENPATGCPASVDTMSVHVREIKAAMAPLDDTYCIGEPFMFNAGDAQDVNGTCWQGYTWFPSDSRPIETQDASIDYAWSGRGEQTVELIVVDINGCQDTIRDTTIVFEVRANFTADPIRLCAPGTVNFTDLSDADARLEEWKWIFGDNPADTISGQNQTHTFNDPPMPTVRPDGSIDTFYVATLIAFDSLNCSDTVMVELDFYKPFTNIQVSDFELCVGDEITFDADDFTQEGSNLNYGWFLNGTPISTDKMGTILFDGAAPTVIGTNTLEVRATEADTGCPADPTAVTITVQDFPDPGFTSSIDGTEVNCAGQIVTFSSASNANLIVDYIWDMGDGTVVPNFDNPSNFDYSFDTGTFNVSLTATSSFGCATDSTRQFIFVGPEGDLTINPIQACVGDEILFEVSNLVDVTSYTVEYGDGDFIADTPSSTHVYSAPNTYEAILRMDFTLDSLNLNCPVAVSQDVIIGGIPDLALGGEFQYCRNDLDNSLIFLIDPQPDWGLISWNPAAFVQPLPGQPDRVRILPGAPDNFTLEVSVTDLTGGCNGFLIQDINIFQDIDVPGNQDTILVQRDQTNIPLTSLDDRLQGLNINWKPDTELDLTDPLNPILRNVPRDTITYNAIVSDDNLCYLDTFIRFVSTYEVPNIFSPNGDMLNQNFNLKSIGGSRIQAEDIASFEVFNRWGQRVYNNETPDRGWDGTFDGNEQPTDVYVYKISVRFRNGTIVELDPGDVTLLR